MIRRGWSFRASTRIKWAGEQSRILLQGEFHAPDADGGREGGPDFPLVPVLEVVYDMGYGWRHYSK